MDVVERSFYSLGREEVPIKARAFLPEPKALLTGAFTNGQAIEQWRLVLPQHLFNFLREGLFQSSQKTADVRVCLSRQDKQVNMFGHEHKGNQFKVFIDASCVDTSCQLLSPVIIGKQRLAVVARES